ISETRSWFSFSPAATAWGFDAQDVPCSQPHSGFRSQPLAVQQIRTRLAIGPARSPGRAVAPPFGEQRRLHRRERLELAHHTVATGPLPCSAAPAAQRIRAHPQRMLELEHLDRRVQRVGHADMNARGAIRATTRTLPATNRLIVGPAPCSLLPAPAK